MTIKRVRENVDPAEITPDQHNANKGTERGGYILRKSMMETGPGKAPVLDRHGRIVAGNKTVEMAVELGIPLDVIQTHGEALVIHQRLDLDLDETDGAARRMSFMDNLSTEHREWEADVLKRYQADGAVDLLEWFRPHQLRDIGIAMDEIVPGANPPRQGGFKPVTPAAYVQEGATMWTFPGQRFQCGRHVIIAGEEMLPGEVEVMLRAWEKYTGGTAELLADDEEEQYDVVP